RRATLSPFPPGGNGTMMRIGRFGYCCAEAVAAIANAAITTATMVFNITPPDSCLLAETCALLALDLGGLDDFAPACDLALDAGAHLLRRRRLDDETEALELGVDLRHRDRAADLSVQPIDDRLGCAGGRRDARPRGHLEALEAGRFLDRGHVLHQRPAGIAGDRD